MVKKILREKRGGGLKNKILYFYVKILVIYYNFLCIFIFSKAKRDEYRKCKRVQVKTIYLKEYLYAINNIRFEENSKKPNIIWICWLQGEEKAPEIVKMCINSIRKFYQNKYKIVIITNQNIDNYVGENSGGENNIPNYIFEKRKKGYITNTQFSDILRLCLLAKYGGIWMDATIFLSNKIPEIIINSDFFAFHADCPYTGNSWFLVSNKNNILVNCLRALMLEYWKYENKMIDYFLFYIFFNIIIDKNEKCKNEWLKIPVFYDKHCYDLFTIIFQKYDKFKYEAIKEKTAINKLSYKYNNEAIDKNGTLYEKILNS